eukprot:15713334-Heterocapsa_arctica.AAC.1
MLKCELIRGTAGRRVCKPLKPVSFTSLKTFLESYFEVAKQHGEVEVLQYKVTWLSIAEGATLDDAGGPFLQFK